MSYIVLRTFGFEPRSIVVKGRTCQILPHICQIDNKSCLLEESWSFLIIDFLSVFPTLNIKLLIWEIKRAIEFYLETRHYTIKSLYLKNNAWCESGDEIDHRYQHKYWHLPESWAFRLGIPYSWGKLGVDHGGKNGWFLSVNLKKYTQKCANKIK